MRAPEPDGRTTQLARSSQRDVDLWQSPASSASLPFHLCPPRRTPSEAGKRGPQTEPKPASPYPRNGPFCKRFPASYPVGTLARIALSNQRAAQEEPRSPLRVLPSVVTLGTWFAQGCSIDRVFATPRSLRFRGGCLANTSNAWRKLPGHIQNPHWAFPSLVDSMTCHSPIE